MSTANSVATDAFVKSLKDQRNAAFDLVALKEAEVAQLKAELVLAHKEAEKKDDNASGT